VCQLGNTWIPEFQAIDAILPLDTLIVQSERVNREAFFTGIWETNVVGGKVWVFPGTLILGCFFIGRTFYKALGMQNLHKPGLSGWMSPAESRIGTLKKYAAFSPLLFNDFHGIVTLIMNNNGSFLKENDCYGAFDDPATIEAIKFYLTFFEEGLATRSTTEFPNIYDAFADGDFAMIVTGPWNVAQMRRRAPKIAGRWTTARMPLKKAASHLCGQRHDGGGSLPGSYRFQDGHS